VSARPGRLLSGRTRRAPTVALPLYGLAIFTFFLVTSRWSELFTELGIYLALLGLLLRPANLSFPPPLRWATALLLWALLTAFFAISPEIARAALIERLKALVIFFVVVNALRTPQQLRFFILLMLAAFLIYPVRGSLLNYVHGETLVGRAIWNRIYANPNDLAAITLLMLGLTLAIVTVKAQNKWLRRVMVAYVPVLLVIILLTQSRGCLIGLVLGFGSVLLKRIRQRPTIVGPVLVLVGALALLIPAAAWHRFENMTKLTRVDTLAEADKYGSAAQRFEILKVGWHIFTEHPVLGVGIGCYNDATARYAPALGPRDAHNTYLSLAAEMGVPGLLLWLGLVGSVLAQVRRCRASLESHDRMVDVLWIERAVIGCLVAGLFGTYSGLTIFYLVLGILWAAADVLGHGEAAVPAVRRAVRAR